jgi:hypothetical protein
VSRAGYGQNWLLELKMPGEKLNAKQREWHEWWYGDKYVVRSESEALQAVGLLPRTEGARE